MEYSAWLSQTVGIPDLFLDAKNPRLPDLDHTASQRDIIDELLRHEQVADLLTTIASQGYFPTEVLVCVEEDSRLVVVEGNRRLASLKLLANPELAPADQQARIRAKAKKAATLPREIPVSIAPSRSAAAPLIMDRHTHEGVRSWKPFQQARYVESLAGEMTVEQIAAVTGFQKGEILKNIRTHTMYQIAAKLDFKPTTSAIVRDPRRFNASTLERVIESPAMRKFMGISFDDQGRVVGTVHPDDFKRAYGHIVEDIANNKIDTST